MFTKFINVNLLHISNVELAKWIRANSKHHISIHDAYQLALMLKYAFQQGELRGKVLKG